MRTLLKLLTVATASTTAAVLLAVGVLANNKLYTAQTKRPTGAVHSGASKTAITPPLPDQRGEVLGIAGNRAKQQIPTDQPTAMSQLNQYFDDYTKFLASFGLATNTPSTNLVPAAPSQVNTTTGITGQVSNNNGQTTVVVGGNPILSYVPAVPANGFTGTSLAGFGTLSAGALTSGNTTVSGNLSVSGATTLSNTTLATTTAISLTVSGSATFNGSTTITGLTVIGLNPGLTQGSVAFQGASGLTQDNANLFYDNTNHRLGIATTSPATPLEVNGTARGSLQDKGGQVYNVRAYGATGDGTTDDSAAVLAAITAANGASGGIIYFPAGTYRINSQIVFPNDGATPPKQKSIRLMGAGPSHSGQGVAAAPNGGTILDLRYSGSNGKIVTFGQGYLEIDHLTMQESGATTVTPFIYTTNTTLHIHDVEGFGYSGKTTTSCDQDFIVLGGTTTTIDGTANAPFQGYGTVIENNYMNRLRRFIYFRTYSNGIQVTNNTIWAQSGSNLANGAAIELDGLNDNSTGNYFAGNLIEMVGYPYGFRLTKAVQNTFVGNNLYDATNGSPTLAYYRFESTAQYNIVNHGFGNDSVPLISDASAGANTILTAHQSQISTWAQPWTFSNNQVLFANTSNAGPTIQDMAIGDKYSTRVTASQWFFSMTPSGTTTTEDMVEFLRSARLTSELRYWELQIVE